MNLQFTKCCCDKLLHYVGEKTASEKRVSWEDDLENPHGEEVWRFWLADIRDQVVRAQPGSAFSRLGAQSLSCVWLFATLWTAARQAPLSVGFSRRKCWTGLPLPTPEDLPDPGTGAAASLPSEPSAGTQEQRDLTQDIFLFLNLPNKDNTITWLKVLGWLTYKYIAIIYQIIY